MEAGFGGSNLTQDATQTLIDVNVDGKTNCLCHSLLTMELKGKPKR